MNETTNLAISQQQKDSFSTQLNKVQASIAKLRTSTNLRSYLKFADKCEQKVSQLEKSQDTAVWNKEKQFVEQTMVTKKDFFIQN